MSKSAPAAIALARLVAVILVSSLCFASRASAQATNLVIDSLQGDVTQNEVDTYISFFNSTAPNAALPTNALGDILSYGVPGNNLEGLNYMYRITKDLPSMATERTELLDLAIVWSERFILLRNDQPMGPHQVMWTGNIEPVWITYAAGTANAGYAGSENGDTAGHILYTALNILETPSIWNQPVPDGDPNHFGATYRARAHTYIHMMEDTTRHYFTRYFIDPTTARIVAPSSPSWTVFRENMDAWNRQFLFINDYLRLAQCHAILRDNGPLQVFYSRVVRAATDAFVANAIPVTGLNGEAAYDWGYGNEGDLQDQLTTESGSHASYDMQGIARIFEAGPEYSSLTLENMERYANTIEYVLFDFEAYNANQTTAYYKYIDVGLPPVAPGAATQDYLYPQFYFLTPYNALFWGPAAYGAGVHNNYHNNPYMVAGILYSKHWVYTHPQSLISVASNSETLSGNTATYHITTNSTRPLLLVVSGLHFDATASFSSALVSAGTNFSTLTVTAPSEIANGSTLFTLVGMGLDGLQTLPLSLVATSPDFTLTTSAAETVSQGSPATFTLTVAPENGFTGDVFLRPGYYPDGTTVSFSPQVISGGSGVSVMTVTTDSPAVPGGGWPIQVFATSGQTKHEAYPKLTINNVAQTIQFPPVSDISFSTTTITLGATATSNLAVTYTVTGPASLTGSPTLAGQQLSITGTGTVTVTAAQAGNSYYAAAPAVVRTFNVTP